LPNYWVLPGYRTLNFPTDTKVSITVYSEDKLVTSTLSTSVDKEHVRIVPNPSFGEFKILFGLLKDTELKIEVTDLSGRVVYSEPKRKEIEGHKELRVDLSMLPQGMYLCNIITTEGVITNKITIIN
jgi:Secretion system C-terminal sorting domain